MWYTTKGDWVPASSMKVGRFRNLQILKEFFFTLQTNGRAF